ncbi:MAG TPA: hypothetical protein VF615_27750 [Longimicrobiaceae bacterium]
MVDPVLLVLVGSFLFSVVLNALDLSSDKGINHARILDTFSRAAIQKFGWMDVIWLSVPIFLGATLAGAVGGVLIHLWFKVQLWKNTKVRVVREFLWYAVAFQMITISLAAILPPVLAVMAPGGFGVHGPLRYLGFQTREGGFLTILYVIGMPFLMANQFLRHCVCPARPSEGTSKPTISIRRKGHWPTAVRARRRAMSTLLRVLNSVLLSVAPSVVLIESFDFRTRAMEVFSALNPPLEPRTTVWVFESPDSIKPRIEVGRDSSRTQKLRILLDNSEDRPIFLDHGSFKLTWPDENDTTATLFRSDSAHVVAWSAGSAPILLVPPNGLAWVDISATVSPTWYIYLRRVAGAERVIHYRVEAEPPATTPYYGYKFRSVWLSIQLDSSPSPSQ